MWINSGLSWQDRVQIPHVIHQLWMSPERPGPAPEKKLPPTISCFNSAFGAFARGEAFQDREPDRRSLNYPPELADLIFPGAAANPGGIRKQLPCRESNVQHSFPTCNSPIATRFGVYFLHGWCSCLRPFSENVRFGVPVFFPLGVPVVSRWCPGGVMVSRWCRVVSQWCRGGVPVVSQWCNGPVPVVSR